MQTFIFYIVNQWGINTSFKTTCKFRHTAYERASKRYPFAVLIELQKTI